MERKEIYRNGFSRILFCVFVLILISQFNCIAQVSVDWKYKKELFGYLQKADDSIYITDRANLEEIQSSRCTDTEVSYYTYTKAGEHIQLAIKSKKFLRSYHEIRFSDSIFSVVNKKKVLDSVVLLNKIDGRYAFGVNGEIPETEISSFIILRNNVKIVIPKSAYTDLYNIHYCVFYKAPEVYITKDNIHLYLYLHGSDGINQYSVKFIFDELGYVTRIVNRHQCLTDFDFIDGFGDCE